MVKAMHKAVIAACLAVAFAGTVRAQAKIETTWNCKPTDQHAIAVGDHPGHVYSVSQQKCVAAKGEIEGVKQKQGISTFFENVMGNRGSFNGIFVETLANGDQLHYRFRGKGTAANGEFVSGTNAWTIVAGTGQFKGAKGKGSCQGKGNPDGSVTWQCQGTLER